MLDTNNWTATASAWFKDLSMLSRWWGSMSGVDVDERRIPADIIRHGRNVTLKTTVVEIVSLLEFSVEPVKW